MAANRRRLVESGMVPELAKEVAAQIDAAILAAPDFITGLKISNNATDATNDLDVALGAIADSTGAYVLRLAATNVKQIDAVFAEYTAPGTASGGRAAADDLTGGKWFHVFLIGGPGKNTQPLFATSLTPTLPTGFTYYGFVESIYWTGATIKAFTQKAGRKIIWTVPQTDLSVGTWVAADTNTTILTPLGREVDAILTYSFISSSGTLYGRIEDTSTTGAAVTANSGIAGSTASGANGSGQLTISTNTSSQVRRRSNDASGTGTIRTVGYISHRR